MKPTHETVSVDAKLIRFNLAQLDQTKDEAFIPVWPKERHNRFIIGEAWRASDIREAIKNGPCGVREIVGMVCDCGHEPDQKTVEQTKKNGFGGTGYGTDPETEETLCYACCEAAIIQSLKDTKPGEALPHAAYLVKRTAEGKTPLEGEAHRQVITSWTGAVLAYVSASHPGYVFGSRKVVRFWAQDVHGQWWYGIGPGFGMYVTMRKSKTENR